MLMKYQLSLKKKIYQKKGKEKKNISPRPWRFLWIHGLYGGGAGGDGSVLIFLFVIFFFFEGIIGIL